MRKLAILTFTTLDGVMQAPKLVDEDPSGGFRRGGWADPYWDDVMLHVSREAMAAPYDLLLGRKTYDLFAAHQPTDAVSPMTRATKYVATSSPQTLQWDNSVAIVGDVAAEVSRLKRQPGKLLQVHGSWQLVQTLLTHDLIDEYRIWTFPVLVGEGKRLFSVERSRSALKLVKSEPAGDSGVVMNVYRRIVSLD